MEPLTKKAKLNEIEKKNSLSEAIDETMSNFDQIEREYMEKAFFYANEALQAQEVPVGCIFVYQNEIVAVGQNTVNKTRNATRHAEMNCIDQVHDYCLSKNLNLSEVFKDLSVYVTVEPCIMCAAALYTLEVKSVIFGCKNDRFGGETVFDVAGIMKPVTERKGGYRADDAMNLLKTFYQGVNPNAPPLKVKVRGKKLCLNDR